MKAVVVPKYNAPLEFTELPKPTIKANDEVLIKVAYASLNPIDYKRADGMLKIIKSDTFPYIPAYDVSGTVESVGSDVEQFRSGDKVFARIGDDAPGTLAEFVVTPSHLVAHAPKSISLEEAAAVPLAGMTALQTIRRAGFSSGQSMLVTAGAGGVGIFALGLAKNVFNGAEVATTASTKKVELVRSLGATKVIDYTKQDYTKELKDVDFVFDTMGDLKTPLKVIRQGGRLSTIAGIPPASELIGKFANQPGMPIRFILNTLDWWQARPARSAGVTFQSVFMQTNGKDLAELAGYIDEGKLKVVLDSTYALQDAQKAWDKLKDGHATGKIVVAVA
ncbi:uncharacterized protein L969DRAFT_84388 [Mixia osmundae IAM 14324]|uniref:Enoyl reductase (ER) domain-containing protein n=1 Tax=Mixia osmundae (strain CBS 9802 / IAM 14324 / JCM 22182 / KY 12970) TaxID=764103 RepID=G7E305_MIXOS|nr:uncharacterized protein L969DRAFT_84388 [Mixia osmundae IAM 14324]KEI42525.1 hypothetical protein L969DRAFT_84388 [Mixia osmundae IAM 14324]GAA97186.1 hypothetical protein E5Q_03862 [Mixia osmundae IAM 14324]